MYIEIEWNKPMRNKSDVYELIINTWNGEYWHNVIRTGNKKFILSLLKILREMSEVQPRQFNRVEGFNEHLSLGWAYDTENYYEVDQYYIWYYDENGTQYPTRIIREK